MNNQKQYLAPFFLVAATFIGIADTLYLSYYKWLDITPGCAVGGCETVLTHPSSEPWGFPLAYLGLMYYVAMLVIAVLLAYKPESPLCNRVALWYTSVGLVASIYFEAYQYVVIKAMCLYCGISAVATLILFFIALWHFRATQKNYVTGEMNGSPTPSA